MMKEPINLEKLVDEMQDLLWARDLLEDIWGELGPDNKVLSKYLRKNLKDYFEYHEMKNDDEWDDEDEEEEE